MQFHIRKMSCGGCVATVSDAIRSVDPAAAIEADLAARNVEVTSEQPRTDLEAALAKAGYPAVAVVQ